jgi:hypothetical protein
LRKKGPPCCNGCVGSVATRILWGFILLCDWACIAPFCMIEFEDLKSSLLLSNVRVKLSLMQVAKFCLDQGFPNCVWTIRSGRWGQGACHCNGIKIIFIWGCCNESFVL